MVEASTRVTPEAASTTPWPARLLLALTLVAMTLASATMILPPRAEPVDAANTTFSAGRAMEQLEVVAVEPHPVGSPAQQRVREHLVSEAEGLGLPTEVQPDEVSGAENVIVRVAGADDSGLDVLLTAHYDSAVGAPGAADDGMAVAAMLETMRVLTERERLANDVVFLFTDGEEQGQTGIAAYVDDHPDAARVAVSFVFDGMPDSSGTELRTTTPGDAWLVREVAAASPPLFGNSATNTSDRERLGNDFAAFAPADMAAAEILTEGSVVRYHNAGDNLAAVDEGVLQDQGNTMVALAEHFGDLDLSKASVSDEDVVFLSMPVVGLVAYPGWLALVLALTAAAALVAVLGVARRRGHVNLARLASSAGLVLGLAAVATVASWAVWQGLLAANPESTETLHYPDFEHSTAAMAVSGAVIAAAFVAACHMLSRRLGVLALTGGAAVWWAVAAVLLAVAVPLFSAVALWPLVGAVGAAAVVLWVRDAWVRAALLVAAALPALVVAVPLLILEAFAVEDGPLVAAPVLVLVLGSLMPQLLYVTNAQSA
jgi:hypothetical protein